MKKSAKIGLPILVSLVVGNMIGTGIFVLPASLAAFGSISILSWVFTGVGAIFLALTFANLNKRIPLSGGPFIYCKEAYGDFVGFLVAYTYWISQWVSSAAIVVASLGYLNILIGAQAKQPLFMLCIELAAVWLFTLVNIQGIKTAGRLQLVLTVLKIIPLLIICCFGIFKIEFANLKEFNISGESDLTAMTGAAVLTFWAFIGLETATIPAEHAKSSRDVYRATVYGTLATAIFYVFCTIVLFGLIPPAVLKLSSSPFADAAHLLFGQDMAMIIALCAIIAGFGTLNVCILVQGQVPYAAGRDGLFPPVFAKLNKRGTPAISLIISAVLVSILLFFTMNETLIKQFNTIALLAGLATLATYFISAMAELMLLIRDTAHFNRYRLLKSGVVAILAGVYSFWMIIGSGKETVFYGTLLLFTAFPAYVWLTARKRAAVG